MMAGQPSHLRATAAEVRHDEIRPVADRRSLNSSHSAVLPPRYWPDVWNVPAHAGERFHGGDNPHNQKRYMNERLNDSPKKHQNSTNRRNRPKDQEEDS